MAHILEVQSLYKSFGTLPVLRGIDLTISKKEIVTIIGKSGAGKSTLLHLAGTLDKPDSGKILLNGVQVDTLKKKQLAQFRNKYIGFVFQFHYLLPEFSALENVIIPGLIAKENKVSLLKKGEELLDLVGLSERGTHKPAELSGGEQQRVAIARALINSPQIIFADEPTGNLDTLTSETIHQLIRQLRDELSQTFVIATHNLELAGLSDRTVELIDGKIADQ